MKQCSKFDRILFAGIVVVPGSIAAAGCYWQLNDVPCCDYIVGNPRPLLGGDCPDEITSNPGITHYRNAYTTETGKTNRAISEIPQVCEWISFMKNTEGNCVVVPPTPRTNTCTPVTTFGSNCTGTATP